VTWFFAFGVLLTFGIAAPILFAMAGTQARKRSWLYAAALYALMSWGGIVLVAATPTDSAVSDIGAALFLIEWLAATAHAFVIRGEYQRRLAGAAPNPLEAARSIVETRKEAQRLVLREPDVARELGVGRPDLPQARSMGVIDVNGVSAEVLATLPGIDNHLARDIVRAREEIDGFKSLEDMGGVMSLDGNLVEDLRRYVVFVPR
jgi:DNA uptake protein ComE-like DNA-binding protein